MKWQTALILVSLSACSLPTPRQAGLVVKTSQEAELAQFQSLLDTEYIAPFRSGDVDRWLRVFDTDVVGLHNFLSPMEGKESLRNFGLFVRDNLKVADMSVKLEGIRREGGLAYTWGRYHSRLLIKSSGEPMPGHSENGKVLFIWKLQKDGGWKISVDMGNALQEEIQSFGK